MKLNSIYDCHVHSNFSFDGRSTMKEMCEAAIRKSLRGISFTDHIDSEKQEYLNDPEVQKKYVEEIAELKRYYSRRLDIICSYELSSPHRGVLISESLESCFDCRMISVHHAPAGVSPENRREYIRAYLMEAKAAVCSGQYHVLGHVDLLRRFYGNFIYEENQLENLYNVMLQRNMALEINTHSFKKIASPLEEDFKYLQKWKECGGKHVVFGSDAHSGEKIAERFEEIQKYLPEGLEIGHFSNGVFITDQISG